MPEMKPVHREILEQVIAAGTEPLLVVRIDQPDWPVVLVNPAFRTSLARLYAWYWPFLVLHMLNPESPTNKLSPLNTLRSPGG